MTRERFETLSLFPEVDAALVAVLEELEPSDWLRPTLAGHWRVRDVAAHLLDGYLRTISLYRDGYSRPPDVPIRSYSDLAGFLNRLNAEFVKTAERFSTELLVEALKWAGPASTAELARLSPDEEAVYSVAWAGQTASANWFHIAREYTERMHHQLQIREAVSRTAPLMEHRFFHPFIHTLLYGLPPAYKGVEAQEGTMVGIRISGAGGGDWHLVKKASGWALLEGVAHFPAAALELPDHAAWKLLTKGMTPEAAAGVVLMRGNGNLSLPALKAVSVMA